MVAESAFTWGPLCTWTSSPWTECWGVSKGDNTENWSQITLSRQRLGTYLLIRRCPALVFIPLSLSPTKFCCAFGNSWCLGLMEIHLLMKRRQPWLALYLSASEFECSRSYYQINTAWKRKKKTPQSHQEVTYESPSQWSPWGMGERTDARRKRGSHSSQKSLLKLRIQSPEKFDFRSSIFHIIYWKNQSHHSYRFHFYKCLCMPLMW